MDISTKNGDFRKKTDITIEIGVFEINEYFNEKWGFLKKWILTQKVENFKNDCSDVGEICWWKKVCWWRIFCMLVKSSAFILKSFSRIVCFHPSNSHQDHLLWYIKNKRNTIICFESKKHFTRIVRFGKIVCLSPKDRLLSTPRSSAFSRIVCFQHFPLFLFPI